MITQLDSENADRNLTSAVTVLTHTPDADAVRLCRVHVALGDGSKNLDGTGGNFTLAISVGGQSLPAETHAIAASVVRAALQSAAFLVPANAQVIAQVTSPNGADSDVDVTAVLYDAQEGKLPNLAAFFLNARSKKAGTSADMEVKADDGITNLYTVSPAASVTVSGANFTHSSLRLAKSAAFASYVHHAGDQISITDGTGVNAGTYDIDAKIDDDTIELGSSITGAADVSDSSVDGVISNNTIMVPAVS